MTVNPACRARLLLPVALVLALAASPPRAQPGKGEASPVTVVTVERREVRETVPLSGGSIPWRRTLLSPQVSGMVTEVPVEEGDWVGPGDPVLVLDDQLAAIDVKTAEARLREARVRLGDAERRRDELERLIADRHVSETDLESAVAEVEAARAVVARQGAELERAREVLRRHTVEAPFAGMVTRKGVDPGQWAKPDSDLLELVAVDTIRVRAPLPQRYYPRVREGSPARVRFEAVPERVFDGTVFAKVAAGDAATRSFPLLIDIPNPEHLLAPGMSARVDVELGDGAEEALVVPRDAVITRVGGERMVWRVDDAEDPPVAERVAVRTGRAYREHLEVLGDSLAPGDRVVLLGNESLRPGAALKVLEAAPGAAGR